MATVQVPYPVVDLFAGPGGLGEGFASLTGEQGNRRFESVVAIERDEFSYQTLLLRHFLRRFPSDALPDDYSLAVLSELTKRHKKSLDFQRIWNAQGVNSTLEQSLAIIAKAVNEDIIKPTQGISNISEWCKKDACWTRIQGEIDKIEAELPDEFWNELVSVDDAASEVKSAKKTQKIDNGIEAQRRVLEIPVIQWTRIQMALSAKRMLSPKEMSVLKLAEQMPAKIPSELQCGVLLEVVEKARSEGIVTG